MGKYKNRKKAEILKGIENVGNATAVCRQGGISHTTVHNRLIRVAFILCVSSSSCLSSKKSPVTYSQRQLRQIKDLKFFPINGLRFRISELNGFKAIAVFMRDGDCPLSERYGSYIADLEAEYSKKGIKFIYNYVGKTAPIRNAKKDLTKFGFRGPYFIDSKQTIIRALSAQTAGEVFILNAERKIIYKGPVVDLSVKPNNHYVSDILKTALSAERIVPKEISVKKSSNCVISRPVIKKRVFWSDVAPVIQKKCTSCHNPSGSGPIDYLSYEDVAGRKAMFRYVIENDLMPPASPHSYSASFRDEISLTSDEKSLLIKWLNTGSKIKKKSARNLQSPSSETGIHNPDYSITFPEIKIPAEGAVPVKRFIMKTRFPTDKYIKELEFITKPKVLHHITLNICEKKKGFNNCADRPGAGKYMIAGSSFGWAPGAEKHEVLPDDTGIKIPKNAEIILYLHYEPVGREIIDGLTEIRFLFHKHPPSNQLAVLKLYDTSLKIPPEMSNYKSSLFYRVKNSPLTLMAVIPHMHLRGKASSALFTEPSGKINIFFNLDPWNFKSQMKYLFENPVVIPKNSTLQCINWFDNSSDNIINPNPKKTVSYGFREQDEMSMCIFYIVLPVSNF